jgi:hypothetical protein
VILTERALEIIVDFYCKDLITLEIDITHQMNEDVYDKVRQLELKDGIFIRFDACYVK